MFEVVVLLALALVGSVQGPDPCCLRVSPYHIQALAQRMSQRFYALEIRAQDLRNIFYAFQHVHGNVSNRLRFLESDHANLHSEVMRINTRLQVIEAEQRREEYRQRLNLANDWYNPYRTRRESKLSNTSDHGTNSSVPSEPNDIFRNTSDVLTVLTDSNHNITNSSEFSSSSSEVEENSSHSPFLLHLPIPESKTENIGETDSDVSVESEHQTIIEDEYEEDTTIAVGQWDVTEPEVSALPETNAPEIRPELQSLEVTETMFEAVAPERKNDNTSDLQATECCNDNVTTPSTTEDTSGLMMADSDLSDAELQEALRDLDRLLNSTPRDEPEENEDPEKVLLKKALALALEALDRTSDACLQLVNVTADAFEGLTDF